MIKLVILYDLDFIIWLVILTIFFGPREIGQAFKTSCIILWVIYYSRKQKQDNLDRTFTKSHVHISAWNFSKPPIRIERKKFPSGLIDHLDLGGVVHHHVTFSKSRASRS